MGGAGFGGGGVGGRVGAGWFLFCWVGLVGWLVGCMLRRFPKASKFPETLNQLAPVEFVFIVDPPWTLLSPRLSKEG